MGPGLGHLRLGAGSTAGGGSGMDGCHAPHHLPHEPLSELSYCIYLARVLPKQVCLGWCIA